MCETLLLDQVLESYRLRTQKKSFDVLNGYYKDKKALKLYFYSQLTLVTTNKTLSLQLARLLHIRKLVSYQSTFLPWTYD